MNVNPVPFESVVGELIRMWNSGLRESIRRLVWDALPTEKAQARRPWLKEAARMMRGGSVNATAKAIEARMLHLANNPPGFIDTGTPDGCLTVALLVDGMSVKSVRSITTDIDV